MIFFSNRNNRAARTSSNSEACLSIIGLILTIGLIGGLSTLIYGLVKGNLSGTIGGGVVLGVSALLSIILVLVFVYCLKNNDVNSNVNQQRTSPHQRQRKHNRQHQGNREQTSSHEITVISGTHNYNNHSRQPQQHTSNEYNAKAYSQPNQTMGLADSTNSTNGQQLPLSPAKNSSFWLNQSNGSMMSQSQQSISNTNMRRDNYNRH